MAPETLSAADALAIPYARILGVLGLTLVLTVIAALGLRRLLTPGSVVRGRGRLLVLQDALALGPRRAIYVIEAAGKALVIGAAGDQLTLLTELPKVEAPAPPPAQSKEPAAQQSPAFARVLDAARKFEARQNEVVR
jgi:flagellar biogenesis protein FliO